VGGYATAQSRRVAVLMGGRSAEREISLGTGRQALEALRECGHETAAIDTGDPGFIDAVREWTPDVAFICLHGRFGEDGTMQGLLELLDIPYTGSGVLASALAMNKVLSKQVFTINGIPTPDYIALRRGDDVEPQSIVAMLGEQTVVKPANEGSSVGMTIVKAAADLPEALAQAFGHDATVLVEKFVEGTEVTVGLLGNDEPIVLPTLEIVPANEYYDYESKYVPGKSTHIVPARLDVRTCEECERLALATHMALMCRGMSRVDQIVTMDGDVFVLEVNTIPGMTPTSLLPEAALAAGIDFPELCDRLVGYALEDSPLASGA
jgi:D-alanine-D-alanine ligase